jgi:putative tricarboxylic transport membrane protein
MNMKKTYAVANLVWLAFSIAICVESWRLGLGGFHQPGSGFLLFFAGGLLGILALISLIQSLKDREPEGPRVWAGVNFLKLGLLVGALFVYTILLPKVGFLLDTFLLLLFLFRVIEPYRWRKVFFASLLTIVVTYIFFGIILESRLPEGFLRFIW